MNFNRREAIVIGLGGMALAALPIPAAAAETADDPADEPTTTEADDD